HRFAPRTQQIVDRVNHLLIAGFGAFAAYYGVKLCITNWVLTSPGLGLNLAWLYGSSVVGGAMIALYGLIVAGGFAPVPLDDAEHGTASHLPPPQRGPRDASVAGCPSGDARGGG